MEGVFSFVRPGRFDKGFVKKKGGNQFVLIFFLEVIADSPNRCGNNDENLIGAENSRLFQHGIKQSGLPMVNVGNNSNIP